MALADGADGVDDLEGQVIQRRENPVDSRPVGLTEGVIDMHEHGRAGSGAGREKQVSCQRKAISHQINTGREVAECVLVALLRDLRSRCDVDDERDALLFSHLGNGQAGA